MSGERLSRELLADGVVHALGLALGIVGAAALVGLAVIYGNPVLVAPLLVYAAGLVAMLGCSAAYNLIALHPFMVAFDTATLALLATGGILYSVGVVFHLWRRLPFHNAIWHGFVLVAAGIHYFAVLTVIPTTASM